MRIEEFTKPAGAATECPRPAAPAWDLPVAHFSATQFNMLEVCPEQYRQRYILGKKEPPAQAKLLGKVTHSGIEFGFSLKILTEEEPDLTAMLDHYHDQVWPSALDEVGGKSEVIWDDEPEEVRAKGDQMIKSYHPQIARLEPEAVEERFELDLGLQVPVIGYVDLTQKHDRPSIDLKTSKQKESKLKPDWRAQARVYQLAQAKPVDFHVITKAKYPTVVTGMTETGLVEPYSEQRAAQTVKRIAQAMQTAEHYYRVYGPDQTWPTRGVLHTWRCGYCAWQSICPEWAE